MDANFELSALAGSEDRRLCSILKSLPLSFILDAPGGAADIQDYHMRFSVDHDPDASENVVGIPVFEVKPLKTGNVSGIARYEAEVGEMSYHDSSSADLTVSHRGRMFVLHYELEE